MIHLILFLRPRNECTNFLANGFIAKQAPVKSTFTRIAPPSKAHPVVVDLGRDFT